MTNQTIDQAKSEAFMGRIVGILNDASLAFMLSVGHRTRLFDTMAALPASTSDEIARAAGLQERYVREWLGAMVTGKIVEYDAATRTYRLPAEHAAALTRAAGPKNLGSFMRMFSVQGAVESKIVDCF